MCSWDTANYQGLDQLDQTVGSTAAGLLQKQRIAKRTTYRLGCRTTVQDLSATSIDDEGSGLIWKTCLRALSCDLGLIASRPRFAPKPHSIMHLHAVELCSCLAWQIHTTCISADSAAADFA